MAVLNKMIVLLSIVVPIIVVLCFGFTAAQTIQHRCNQNCSQYSDLALCVEMAVLNKMIVLLTIVVPIIVVLCFGSIDNMSAFRSCILSE
uniref:Uncharacterized protein n=1 Tax=Ditylenchus dipsaci TaxID=166011 RepID=A0A915EKG7_9BILA